VAVAAFHACHIGSLKMISQQWWEQALLLMGTQML
jgi:hypothetical protein